MNDSNFASDGVIGPLTNLDEFVSWIIYEDDQILVVNKPGWLVCHPSKNGPWSSLVGAVKEYLEVASIHLASRLDRETSGCVLFAKNQRAARYWQKGIETKQVKRSYVAVLSGELPEKRSVSTFLGKDPDSAVFVKQRVTEKSRKSKNATSHFYPLIFRNGYTFCAILTETGRKHQIRVHAQYMGQSLIGEKLYGEDENYYLKFCEHGWNDDWMPVLKMNRQALHGRCLSHEESDLPFKANLPNDLLNFIKSELDLVDDEIESCLAKADELFAEIGFKLSLG
jgi:23S rRNA pseudouridine1911/1915/1917 synthase